MSTDRAERARRRRQARAEAEQDVGNPLREEGVDNDGSPPITEHENELVRKSVMKGQSLLQMLDDDLEAAWVAYNEVAVLGADNSASLKKMATIRGRIRGLAQAIATVKSPFSRQNLGGNSKDWAEVIKRTEDEALARVRARK